MQDRRARALERANRITIRRAPVDPEPPDDGVRGAAAVELAALLSVEAFAWTGEPLPTYARRDIPVRFVADDGA